MALQIAAGLVLFGGVFFFLAGTVGLLRFPDAHSRLHAVAKSDTLGLGLVVAGLCLLNPAPAVIAKLLLIWCLAMASSSAAAYLIAGTVDESEQNR